MKKIEIINRLTNKVLFDHTAKDNTVAKTVAEAVKKNVSLSGANLSCANLSGAALSDAHLRYGDLRNAFFLDANLTGADLQGANLQGANLKGINLSGANLHDANLCGAALRCANLQGANLTYAALRLSDLRCANLQGAIFRDANLTGANLIGVKGLNIPVIKNIHQTVLKAVESSGINMEFWHSSCGTMHCHAGWVTHLAGKEGKDLEERAGTRNAALLIYSKSTKIGEINEDDFAYDLCAKKVLSKLRHLAKLEKESNYMIILKKRTMKKKTNKSEKNAKKKDKKERKRTIGLDDTIGHEGMIITLSSHPLYGSDEEE